MAKITVQYDDGRKMTIEAAQFVLLHVRKSHKEESMEFVGQCQNDFLDAAISDESNAKVKESIRAGRFIQKPGQ
jgi:hypothetical protein